MKLSRKFAFFKVFSSHMVLQREQKIRLSGTAEPGKSVIVSFDGLFKHAKADKSGTWEVHFPEQPAGGPHTIRLAGAEDVPEIVLDDVLTGEVWFCSGQSNMAFEMTGLKNQGKDEIAAASHPQIRLFNVTAAREVSPNRIRRETPGSGWTRCTPETAADFSACAYFFGRQLNRDLKVPVGLISSSWGGTNIEAWISAKDMRKNRIRHYSNLLDLPENELKKVWAGEVRNFPALQEWLKDFDERGKFDPDMLKPGFDDSAWELKSGRVVMPKPGRYLLRIRFTLPADFRDENASIHYGNVDDCETTYLNGEKIGATGPDIPVYYSIKRNYLIRKGLLHAGENILVIAGDDHFHTGYMLLDGLGITSGGKEYPLPQEGRFHTVFQLPENHPIRPPVPALGAPSNEDPDKPSTLYNGMVAPWFRYGIRGTIWYQGCNNNGQFQYYDLHKKLIQGFRDGWNNSNMPFLIVQLTGFNIDIPMSDDEARNGMFPEAHPYAVTREIQAEMANVMPHTGVVTAFDAGEPANIHPLDKQTVGSRLAKRAEGMIYGAEKSGKSPEYRSVKITCGEARIRFANAEGGLKTTDGEPPRGFRLGDRNGGFFMPQSVEIQNDTVILRFPQTLQAERIRYAFTGYCSVNLVNREGLPAAPFRTDKPDYENMFER